MSLASAVLALGLTTSCSDEQGLNETTVTFTVEMNGEQASRAYNDGLKAKQLIFAVYEAGTENELKDLRQEDVRFNDQLKATVTTQLVKGKKYDFVFWAQPEGSTTFTVTDMRHIQVNYQNANCNDDMRDAFYQVLNTHHAGVDEIPAVITLTRPFAQVNFATADWEEAVSAGVGTIKSAMAVKSVFTQLNTYDGTVEGETTATFNLTDIPSGDNEMLLCDYNGDGIKEEYRWIAMTYVLVPPTTPTTPYMSNGATLHVNGATVDNTVEVPNVEMGRNYRTNILGNLLTTGAVFNVVINPIPLEPDNNKWVD